MLTTPVMSSDHRTASLHQTNRPSRKRHTPKYLEDYLLDERHQFSLSSHPIMVTEEQRGATAAVSAISQAQVNTSQGEHSNKQDLISSDALDMGSLRRLLKSMSDKDKDEAVDMAALHSKLKRYETRQHRRRELMEQIASFIEEEGEEDNQTNDTIIGAATRKSPQV